MFIYPWLNLGWSWGLVEDVWDRWQGLNVGMLAFISSVTAFNIGRYNAEKQREREFMASKAFLPDALSGLTSYLQLALRCYGKAGRLLEEMKSPHLFLSCQQRSSMSLESVFDTPIERSEITWRGY